MLHSSSLLAAGDLYSHSLNHCHQRGLSFQCTAFTIDKQTLCLADTQEYNDAADLWALRCSQSVQRPLARHPMHSARSTLDPLIQSRDILVNHTRYHPHVRVMALRYVSDYIVPRFGSTHFLSWPSLPILVSVCLRSTDSRTHYQRMNERISVND